MLSLGQAFALIAILIGCMGLYGLVAFMAETKEKEIGIRKVLGATVGQVLWLFGREFTKLLVIGFVAASMLGWFLMRAWLQDYHYRIDLGWWVFASAGLLSLAIAFITVSFQSVKAALANPVKSLRNE